MPIRIIIEDDRVILTCTKNSVWKYVEDGIDVAKVSDGYEITKPFRKMFLNLVWGILDDEGVLVGWGDLDHVKIMPGNLIRLNDINANSYSNRRIPSVYYKSYG